MHLGRFTLQAIASTQPQYGTEVEFWKGILKDGPESWLPSAFIGLRLSNLQHAIDYLPDFVNKYGDKTKYVVNGLYLQLERNEQAMSYFISGLQKGLEKREDWSLQVKGMLYQTLGNEQKEFLSATL